LFRYRFLFLVVIVAVAVLCNPRAASAQSAPSNHAPSRPHRINSPSHCRTSTGTVTSSPAGISCAPTCTASFGAGTVVNLPQLPQGSIFHRLSGACKGTGVCTLTMNAAKSATATFNIAQTVSVLNHIIFMAQENRSLDHYSAHCAPIGSPTDSPIVLSTASRNSIPLPASLRSTDRRLPILAATRLPSTSDCHRR